MRGSRKFCQRASNFDAFFFFFFFFFLFFFDEGREDLSTTVSGPSSDHQRNASWRADEGAALNAGLVAATFRGSGPVLLEKNPIFCDI